MQLKSSYIRSEYFFFYERLFEQACSNLTLRMIFFTYAWDMISMSVATKKKKQNLWRWMNCLSFSLKKANRISWLPVESRWQQAKASCWCPWHLIIACGATFHRALTKFRKSEVEEVEESLLCSSSFVLLPRLSHSKLPQCHLYAGSPVQAIVLYNKWINIPQSHQNRLVIFILMPGEDSEVAYFAYFVHFIVFVCVFLELISKFSGSLNYILIKHDPYGSCFFFFFSQCRTFAES